MTAPIRDIPDLVRALVHAREERRIPNENIDEIAGLPARYTTKVLAGAKGLGPVSFIGIMGALGKCLVLVDDPDQIKQVQSRWQKRKRIHSRAAVQAVAASIDASEREMLEFTAKLQLSQRMRELGKMGAEKGASNGGKRRARVLRKAERQAIAAHAARTRWAKQREAQRYVDGKGKKRAKAAKSRTASA